MSREAFWNEPRALPLELSPTCRYCHDSTEEPLIQPCKCAAKIHFTCLHAWNTTRKDSPLYCSECKSLYTFYKGGYEMVVVFIFWLCATVYDALYQIGYTEECEQYSVYLYGYHLMTFKYKIRIRIRIQSIIIFITFTSDVLRHFITLCGTKYPRIKRAF